MVLTPLEKLQKANDDYHEAVQEIYLSGDYTVEKKTQAGAIWNTIFTYMKSADNIMQSEETEE